MLSVMVFCAVIYSLLQFIVHWHMVRSVYLAQNTNKWQAVVNSVVNQWVA